MYVAVGVEERREHPRICLSLVAVGAIKQYFALIYSSLHLAAHHKPYASAAAFEDLKQSSPPLGTRSACRVVLLVAVTAFKA